MTCTCRWNAWDPECETHGEKKLGRSEWFVPVKAGDKAVCPECGTEGIWGDMIGCVHTTLGVKA
jgi:hypothetical protein